MQFPLLTAELAGRLEKPDTNYIAIRLQALNTIEGNPFGATVKNFGSATGLAIRSMTVNSLFNRVAGFGPADLVYLPEILEWFEENKIGGRFDLLPSNVNPHLFQALTALGFAQTGFYAALYGLPEIKPRDFPGLTIRLLQPDELEIFSEIYMQGHGFPAARREVLTCSIKGLYGNPSVHFYLALVEGIPAGIALLLVHDQIGYLATAATLPAYRGRGCQKALMQRRILDAAQNGCELITSQTNFGSVSQANMEKSGLRLAYTKAIWTRPFTG